MAVKLAEGMSSEEDVKRRLESSVVLQVLTKPVSKRELFLAFQ